MPTGNGSVLCSENSIRMTCYPGTCTATDASSRTRTTRIGREPNGGPIRDCVLEKKIAHCGECDMFPCELMERHLASVESVLKKAREILTGEEYRDFIEPYLSREFLSGRGST